MVTIPRTSKAEGNSGQFMFKMLADYDDQLPKTRVDASE